MPDTQNIMEQFKVGLAKGKTELKKVFKIREIVFIKSQKVNKKIERDKMDSKAKHIIAFYKNKPIGCGRILISDKKAKLQRIAVLEKYRGIGFGKQITDWMVKYCLERGVNQITVHSQYYIKDLYRKSGFRVVGKPFMEARIKHIKMVFKETQI